MLMNEYGYRMVDLMNVEVETMSNIPMRNIPSTIADIWVLQSPISHLG
jgi:hypothetical protein